jgi:hypothetical protein
MNSNQSNYDEIFLNNNQHLQLNTIQFYETGDLIFYGFFTAFQ